MDERREEDRTRVVVCDAQPVMREGLLAIVARDAHLTVVGQAATTAEAIEVARRTEPAVVVVTHEPPDVNGIAVGRALTQHGPPPGVVLLLNDGRQETLLEALQAGVRGLLAKRTASHELAPAIRTVASGSTVLALPDAIGLLGRLVHRFPVTFVGRSRELSELTRREIEVLQLIAKGQSNHRIARDLSLSEATVKSHVYHMCRKLNIRDRTQAVILAYESGLVKAWGA
jgi:DNA-binding NarL/FixJ family response regulator